jgi:hypothetical protein
VWERVGERRDEEILLRELIHVIVMFKFEKFSAIRWVLIYKSRLPFLGLAHTNHVFGFESFA